MRILPLLKGCRAVSVVGTGKGSGKTTTCNYILAEAQKDRRLGITSFGLGGTQTPLEIPQNSLIALAKNCEIAKKLELLDETDAGTPWGPVVIGRAKEDIQTIIAGPLCLSDLKKIKDRLLSLGCDLVVIDSVLDKKSSSSSRVCDCFILSAGIDFSDRDSMYEEIQSQVEVLSIPVATSLPPSFDKHYAKVQEKWIPFDIKDIPANLLLEAEEIFWPGAFVEGSVNLIAGWKTSLPVIVEEPWQLFLSSSAWRNLKRDGWIFKSCFHSPIALVTLNPCSSSGFSINPREFLIRTSEMLEPLKVINLKLNE